MKPVYSFTLKGFDGSNKRIETHFNTEETRKDAARRYLASWMQKGDYIFFREMDKGRLHACVRNEYNEDTDAACLLSPYTPE